VFLCGFVNVFGKWRRLRKFLGSGYTYNFVLLSGLAGVSEDATPLYRPLRSGYNLVVGLLRAVARVT